MPVPEMLPQTQAGDSQRNKPCPAPALRLPWEYAHPCWKSLGSMEVQQNNAEKRRDMARCDSHKVGSLANPGGEAGFGGFGLCPSRSHSVAFGSTSPQPPNRQHCSAAAVQKHHGGDLAQRNDCKRQPIFKLFFPKSFRDGGGFRNFTAHMRFPPDWKNHGKS